MTSGERLRQEPTQRRGHGWRRRDLTTRPKEIGHPPFAGSGGHG